MSDAVSSYNIAAHLPKMAALQPDSPAIHVPCGGKQNAELNYRSYSYAELNRRSDRIALALEAIGIHRGVRTVLMVKPGLDFFALTFALFKVGAVPILIDPGMGIKNLKACLQEAEPHAFIGIPQAHAARLLFGWGKPNLRILLTLGPVVGWGGSRLQQLLQTIPETAAYQSIEPAANETAAILFTSGSTGVPKGAVYSHANFIAQVDALKQAYGIEPGEVDVPTFPLFALFAPALGMTAVVPQMDFTRPGAVDPEKIITAIKQFNATTMFGSPALIRRVADYGFDKQVQLPTLRRVISAGAPVPAVVLERFSRLLSPAAEIFTPYGATEALPVCSVGSKIILEETAAATDQGQGVCVGRPVDGLRLEIIAISDAPIEQWDDDLKVADGQIGEIVVQGSQVTRSYYNRPDSTRLAKIKDPTGGFFHRMGDLGYRDEQGRIWFCGRKTQRVACARETLFTIPCEALFNCHQLVRRSALVGVKIAGEQQPVICVELEKGVKRSQRSDLIGDLQQIAESSPVTRSIRHFLVHPEFPVDIRHNAKIFREKLARWAQQELR
jgi:acyl-CoA synthetase (AMP-forming)/AMP-acid ligase II